jgi:hypothetical protein
VSPKRSWLQVLVAIVLAAAGVGVAIVREDPLDDSPRLVIVRQEQQQGQEVVVFRFHAPKHRKAYLKTMFTQNPSTRVERRPVGVGGIPRPAIRQRPWGPWEQRLVLNPPLMAEAGQSTEFSVLPPPDDVWRLRGDVAFKDTGVKGIVTRLRACWRNQSLAPLRWDIFTLPHTVQSDLLINAMPSEIPASGW